MKNYPIRIAVSANGETLIGAKSIKGCENIADQEKVYSSQLPHRCAVQTEKGTWIIALPSAAKRQGKAVKRFV